MTSDPRHMVPLPFQCSDSSPHNTQNRRYEEWRNGECGNRDTGMGIGMEPTIKLDIRPVLVYCDELYIVAIAEHVGSY